MNKKPSFTEVNDLLDIYEKCLTSKQIKIMKMKYRLDLSLAEISENLKITRSGVLDTINESIKKLLVLESNIKYLKKRNEINEIINNKNLDLEKVKRKIKGVL